MKRVALCLTLAGLLGLSGPAAAVIGTIDDVPAATLLLPYFEVSLGGGITTLFSINNASATAVLAKVTVWSDQSVPVLDFDVYLTGYDVLTINMRDILIDGNLPLTASDGQDPLDTISPQGPLSQDINFASCTGVLPYDNPAISPSFRTHLQAWLIGNQSPVTANCAAANYDGSRSGAADDVMKGYVTIDTVNACNLLFPAQLSTGYDAFLTDQNVLWGDYFYVSVPGGFAQGETLVHIEACVPPGSGNGTGTGLPDPVNCPFVPGDHTFYGRYATGTAIDQREPLPTTLAARFINGGPFPSGTDFVVWREGDANAAGYACALPGPASWYPLPAFQIVLFDEDENPVQQEDCPSGDPTCEQEIGIPNEAQRVSVLNDLLSPFNFGWAYLNLQHDQLIPAYGDDDAQAWVTAVMEAFGTFSVGYDAIQLDNANSPNTLVLPVQ